MKRGLPFSFLKVYLDFEILLLKFAYKHMHMGDFFYISNSNRETFSQILQWKDRNSPNLMIIRAPHKMREDLHV